ncbi:hypothetical protein HYH03_004560 [Edaphochlamys debaryana]|uniref:Uncharacterized protein n=1 Tax=Edaphochlamys debaryana TaxID=47281 RepID=A0A835YEP0_9CHLO|nr:hypothetical protein HYH03_004560 [Edaphochlamys debaryana]|eukprot:KAG2497405.1 hypothetical protein HYH03_004560 [Edaphochlamys debaryana]
MAAATLRQLRSEGAEANAPSANNAESLAAQSLATTPLTAQECCSRQLNPDAHVEQAQALYNANPAVGVAATQAPLEPSLLALPTPLFQIIIAGSGTGLAALACRGACAAFGTVLAQPELAARFLFARHGRSTALYHVYGSQGFRQALVRDAPDRDSEDATLNCVVTELIYGLGAAVKPQARFLLAAASGAGDTRVVRTLLRAGVDAAACGGRALVAASSSGQLGPMEALMAAGVSARAENGMPLRAAAREGQLAAARLLLSRGADPRAAAGGALAVACSRGHLPLVLELLAAGADPRADASRALVEAAAAGHAACVLALLVAGAPPNARNGAAAQKATANGHEVVANILHAASVMVPNGATGATSAVTTSSAAPAGGAASNAAAAAAAASAPPPSAGAWRTSASGAPVNPGPGGAAVAASGGAPCSPRAAAAAGQLQRGACSPLAARAAPEHPL